MTTILGQKLLRNAALAAFLAVAAAHGAAFGQAPALPYSTPAADQLFASGQFEAASQMYAAELRAHPADTGAQAGIVRVLMRLDRWEDALTAAQTFAVRFPTDADAHGLLALALIRAGWQDPYRDEAKKSLALDPQDYWGLVASGRIADWDAKTEDARALYRKAAELHPEIPDALADQLQLADYQGHIKEELEIAKSYVKLNPQGHPHEEIVEDAKDLLANADAYGAAFITDTPYQHSQGSEQDSAKAEIIPPAALTIEFVGDDVVFPVTIAGLPFRLLFDTGGGDDVLLSWKAAQKLHLPVIAHSYVRGVSGKEKSDTLKAQTMTLAGRAYRSIKIRTSEGFGSSFDGILGGDTARDAVITLDTEKRTVSLTQSPDAQAPAPLPGDKSVVLPFHFYHGKLYIQSAVNSIPVWALVDTGDDLTLLSLRLARQQLKTVSPDDIRNGTLSGRHGVGNSNRKTDYIASRAESQITVSSIPPIYIPMQTIGTSDVDQIISPSPECDFEVGLWLGMSSFTYARRLTFDYPHRLMTFEYTDPDSLPKPDAPKQKKK